MAFVQGDKASGSASSSLTTAGITTTTGNTLLAISSSGNGPKTLSSITDSKGNTWTALTGNPQVPGGARNVYGYIANITTGGAGHTVTANYSGSCTCALSIVEFSGRHTTTPIAFQAANLEGANSGSHTSAATGTISPTGCDLVCLAADNSSSQFAGTQTYTPTSTGWSIDTGSEVNTAGTTETSYVFYKNNVGTTTDTATWTNSGGSLTAASWIIALAPAAGGGSSAKLLTMISNQAGF